nr:MAG: putative RNA-dependent RNA polymerase [Partitiviridae sp.]
MSQTNLLFVGKVAPTILKQMRRATQPGFWSDRIKTHRTGIVVKAIKKYCSQLTQDQILLKRRSNSTDEAVIEDFMSYEQPLLRVKRDYHYNRALHVTAKLFNPGKKLRPIHFPDQRYYPWTLNVSAEAPWTYQPQVGRLIQEKQRDGLIDDNRRSFHNLYDEIFIKNRLLIHLIKDGHEHFWTPERTPIPYEFTNLHARAHVVDYDEPDKIRAVFGVPKLLLMAEQHFIWPLQETYLNGHVDSPMLWGNEMIKGGWRKLWNKQTQKLSPNTVLSTDWSQFDKRALHEVIDDVHNIWRSYFTFEEGYVPTNFYPHSTTESWRLENLWKWMCHSIKHTPICLPDGKKYIWTRNGIASGYQQTQLLDSFVNTIMILTILSETGVNIESPNFFIKVQGDDCLIAFDEQMFAQYGTTYLGRLADLALERFNAKLSDKKSQISNDLNGIKVLGYSNILMRPTRTDADLLSHLLYPERSWGLPELAASAVGIAWASLACSKTVYLVCKDVHSYLTEKLGIKPNPKAYTWLQRIGALTLTIYHLERFPTFSEIYDSTYSVEERSLQQRERLYPTEPQSAGGFMFYPY